MAHSWVQNIWATLHCDIYCVAAYTTGVVRFFFEGLSRPKEKPPVFFFLFFVSCLLFCQAFLSESGFFFVAFFLWFCQQPFSKAAQGSCPDPACLLGQKNNQKQGVSSCPCTAAVFHSERKRAQSIYAFFSLPVGTTAKRYPLGFVGRRKRSSFQRNLLGTLFKTTTLSAFWFALECARCGNFENEMYVPLTSFNDSCWCKKMQ